MTKFPITWCLLLLPSALFVGVATAQTLSGPTAGATHPTSVSDRQLQSTRLQIGSREANEASQQDRAVQSEIDHLYDEIMHAAGRRTR